MENLNEILLSSGLTAGGIGSIIWYFIKRLIVRIDKLEDILTSTDPKSPGLATQMALNIADDKNFVKRFEEHLETHKGIKEEVKEMLEKFEQKMENKFKSK